MTEPAWRYLQPTGKMYRANGSLLAAGYSGAWDGLNPDGPTDHRNKPEDQELHAQGPIPRGVYTIGPSFADPHKGPVVMHLTPDPTNAMFGRSGFLIHGDSVSHPGQASEGCIILPREARESIAASQVRRLVVA